VQINADFDRRVVIDTTGIAWQPSPEAGVERKLLDRIGEEVARATSLVRYAPGSRFAAHEHGLGEEFLVLAGTFCDEYGDYPAGTYVRNPPASQHGPWSVAGCEILVKLRQFDPADRTRVVVDTTTGTWQPGPAAGMEILPLHRHATEVVTLMRLAPGAHLDVRVGDGGEEFFVLEGTLSDDAGAYPAGTWVRNPRMSRHARSSGPGCLVWHKAGHLPPSRG
jgi:anti-sigma factor ChrR (cupin superfamily)